MVPPDSHRISRARCYLGTRPGGPGFSCTGLSPSTATPSRGLPLTQIFLTPRQTGRSDWSVPRPRPHNPCRVLHGNGLASSAFARHYSRNHGCFLFLWVLRCFTSPRSLHTPYTFRRGSHHMTGAGFPHSDTLGSTLGWQLPEAYRSLPRPSSAPDAQASTVCPYQLGHTKTNKPTLRRIATAERLKDARVHCAVLNHPPANRSIPRRRTPATAERYDRQPAPDKETPPPPKVPGMGSVPSGPNSAPTATTPPDPVPRTIARRRQVQYWGPA